MWKHPWGYKEGFTISAGLVLTGILLQLTTGAVNTDFLQFPVNVFLGGLYIIFIVVLSFISNKNTSIRWLSGMTASITSISAFLLLVLIMGLTRQSGVHDNSGILGVLGFKNMLSSWSFVLVFIYMMSVLALVTLRRLKHFRWKKDIPFLLNHLGLFITLFAAVLGNADMHRYQMVVGSENPEWRATEDSGKIIEMDFFGIIGF